jgi:hypothetical protein
MELEGMNWIDLSKERWWALVKLVMKLQVPYEGLPKIFGTGAAICQQLW